MSRTGGGIGAFFSRLFGSRSTNEENARREEARREAQVSLLFPFPAVFLAFCIRASQRNAEANRIMQDFLSQAMSGGVFSDAGGMQNVDVTQILEHVMNGGMVAQFIDHRISNLRSHRCLWYCESLLYLIYM